MVVKSYNTRTAKHLQSVYSRVFEQASGALRICTPDETHVDAVTRVLWSDRDRDTLNDVESVEIVVTNSAVIKRVAADFRVGVLMSGLVHEAEDTLNVQYRVSSVELHEFEGGALLGDQSGSGVVLGVGDIQEFFTTAENRDAVQNLLSKAVTESEEFTVGVSPWQTTVGELEMAIGRDAAEFFEGMVGACSSLHPGRDRLDVGDLAVLLGAWFELEQGEVVEWAEDVGVVSESAFVRRRNDWEDAGVIGVGENPDGRGAPAKTLAVSDSIREACESPADFAEAVGEA